MSHPPPEALIELLESPDAPVRDHVAACEPCRLEFERLRSTDASLREALASTPLPDTSALEDRILAAPAASRRRHRMINRFAAAAIVVAFWIGLGYYGLRALRSGDETILKPPAQEKSLEEKMRAVERSDAADMAAALQAFEDLRVELERKDHAEARQVYFRHLNRLVLTPLNDVICAELEKGKRARTAAELRNLSELLLTYRALAGARIPAADEKLPARVLSEGGLWVRACSGNQQLSESVQRVAFRQLEFYLARLESAPRLMGHEGLIVDTLNRLAREWWVRAVYEEIREAGLRTGRFPALGVDLLGSASGADYFHMRYKVPGIFTQFGYNEYVLPRIRERSAALARDFESLGVRKGAEEIAAELTDYYVADYVAEWGKFLDGVELQEFGDAAGARSRLKTLLVLGDTALSQLIDKVWEKRHLRLASGKEPTRLADPHWKDSAFFALQKLFKVTQEFVDTTKRGERFRKYVEDKKIAELGERIVAARSDLATALGGVDNEVRAQIEKILFQPFDRAWKALQAEAKSEIHALWESEVGSFYRSRLEGRYPLKRDAKEDVIAADFVSFFKPKSGRFATLQSHAVELSNVQVEGSPLLSCSDEFKKAMEVVAGFQSTLFRGDKIEVLFNLRGEFLPKRVRHSVTAINTKVLEKEVFDLKNFVDENSRPMARSKLVWSPGFQVFLKFQVEDDSDPRNLVKSTKVAYEDKPGANHWGLFRLMDAGKMTPTKDTEFVTLWQYSPGKEIQLTFTTADAKNPFAKEYFSSFVCPRAVAQ